MLVLLVCLPRIHQLAIHRLMLYLSGLFGTELEQRMEFEKSIIPAIVTRCIQEVELRGEFQPLGLLVLRN